jgi:tetratricopeptide (TPR) repeat protein
MASVNLGERINNLVMDEKWPEARRLIVAARKAEPESHWLLTQLGETYYEQRRYKTALKYLLQARAIQPHCPLTLWHLAGTLDALGYYDGAVRIFNWLLENKTTADEDPCWESKAWTDALKTDCVYSLGVCFRHMNQREKAAHFLERYIRLLLAGAPGSYSIEEAAEELGHLLPGKRAGFEIELQETAKEVRREAGNGAAPDRLPKLNAKRLRQLQS